MAGALVITVVFIAFVVCCFLVIYYNEFTERLHRVMQAKSAERVALQMFREAQSHFLRYEENVAGIDAKLNERLFTSYPIRSDGLLAGMSFPNAVSSQHQASLEEIRRYMNGYSAARQNLNLAVSEYNRAIHRFPGCIVASLFNFEDEAYVGQDSLFMSTMLNMPDDISLDFDSYL